MLKRIIFSLIVLTFCLSTIACKSSYERTVDKVMDDYDRLLDKTMDKAFDEYDKVLDKAMDDFNREYDKIIDEYEDKLDSYEYDYYNSY